MKTTPAAFVELKEAFELVNHKVKQISINSNLLKWTVNKQN